MIDWINWKGLKAIVESFNYTLLVFGISFFYLLYLWGTKSHSENDISTALGFAALIIAVYSIQSTTKPLKEIQTDYWNARGIDQLNKANYHDALQAYEKAISTNPKSTKCFVNKANALLEQGNHNDALDAVEKAIKRGPNYPATLRKGTAAEAKAFQEYANAWKTKSDILYRMDETLRTSPGRGDVLRNQALEAAIKAIELYPTGNPEIPGAWVTRGNALLSLGRSNEAIDAYGEAIRLDSNAWYAWHQRGVAFLNMGKNSEMAHGPHEAVIDIYEESIRTFNWAIGLKPDVAIIWYNKGKALMAQGRYLKLNEDSRGDEVYEMAIHAYDKATEFKPLHLSAWNNKGRCYEALSEYEEAINSYNRALDINPQDIDAQRNRSNAIERQASTMPER